jgi:bifunctional non-homologous end joining protein LigD
MTKSVCSGKSRNIGRKRWDMNGRRLKSQKVLQTAQRWERSPGWCSACNMNLEGIVSKKLDAPYVSGRSGYWTKAKCRDGQEVVLGGWTFEGKTVRSLLAGVFRAGELIYVGRIGTGYGARVVKTLQPRLKALTSDKSPFGGDHPPRQEPNVRWLKPTLVAEIEFAGWTRSGMIRQAVFKGLRQDKPAKEIFIEGPMPVDSATGEPGKKPMKKTATRAARFAASGSKPATARRAAGVGFGRASTGSAVVLGVTISHPDKALWPQAGDRRPVTKLDLAHYFAAVADWMLPHLKGRPCSLVRAPDGIQGEHFFQRHAMPGLAKLFSLVTVRGDKAPYLQIDRIEALAAVAQLGALELHPWNCAPDRPELAGRLVFDLDPAPDVQFEAVIDGATEVRDRLVALGLVPFCKTTGGKGLHVVVPLATKDKQALEWPAAKQFAHLVCAQMAEDSPTKYLDTMSKRKRAGRIFLDYLRNDRLSTAVAPLSPRARDGAAVSMPVVWKDVRRGLEPATYMVRTVPALLQKSRAWADYADSARPLAEAIRAITAPATRGRRRSA